MEIGKHLPSRNSPVVRWGGYVLLAIALVYCGLTIVRLGNDALLDALSGQAWGITLAVGSAYGALLVMLAMAWGGMSADQKAPLSAADRVAIYGPGVVAKYIPGSVFQYGSRQLTGAEFGLSQRAMAKASLFEAGLHIPAALIVAVALLSGGGAIAVGVAMALGAMLSMRGTSVPSGVFGIQLVFFTGFGLSTVLLADGAIGFADPYQMAGFFMLAWVAGFLVPVAPGGLGVRESALLALAATDGLTASVAAFAILTRLATSIGDAAFGLAGYGLLASKRMKRHASS